MSNEIEVVRVEGGTVTFDWSTGEMKAVWDNGYHETWRRNGYSVKELARSFLYFTDQVERANGI